MSLCFQALDVDVVVRTDDLDANGRQTSVIRMFGRTWQGESICVHVHGFEGYFYAHIPGVQRLTLAFCNDLKQTLNDMMKQSKRKRSSSKEDQEQRQELVSRIEIVSRRSIWKYQFSEDKDFVKITCELPSSISSLRKALETGVNVKGMDMMMETMESNFPHVLRFMVDCDVKGVNWITLEEFKFRVRRVGRKPEPESRCGWEVDVHVDHIISHAPDGDWLKIAGFVILSFDMYYFA